MKQKNIFLLGVLGLCLLLVQPGLANYKMLNGAKDFYFGHVSYVEVKNDGKDPLVFREGQTRPEVAILNLPLGPGDLIQTSDARRCEIQFDNGTIVRLDFDTELKIETILAPSLSTAKKVSNLLLAKGQVYVMYKKYDSLEIFQVITPYAAVKLGHHAVAVIGVSEEGADIQLEQGKAQLLYGSDQSHLLELKIKAKERALVTADHQAKPASYIGESDFYAWNTSINENFRVLHEESFLPKPIQKLPKAVVYFAQRYGNLYGEWLWHPLYGYVWRPYYNDSYPWGTWHPLYYGSWTVYQGQLFWIPEEPWGWVPYHLGIWMWDPKKGWLWLPGSIFAPAWAVWDFYFGYYSWRAWSLLDWYYGPYLSFSQFGYGYYWGTSPYATPPGSSGEQVLRSIRKDQLQKKKTISTPIPKEMKKVLQTTMRALERADQDVLSSLREIPRRALAVKKEDLTSLRLREKAISLERFLEKPEVQGALRKGQTPPESSAVSLDALRTIQRSRAMAELEFRALSGSEAKKEQPRPSPSAGPNLSPGRSVALPEAKTAGKIETPMAIEFLGPSPTDSFRFRDWNPDVKTAIQIGVRISYSSRTNEVSCPELGLASRSISPEIRAVGHRFGIFPSSSSFGARVGEGQITSSGATSAGTRGSSETSRSGSGESRGGGEGKRN